MLQASPDRWAVPEQIRGAVYGVAAAALFGLSAPLGKVLVRDSSPVALASLFYLGAAGVLIIAGRVRRSSALTEARLRRADASLLLAVVMTGGVVGPVLMLFGLERVSAVTGSLLLNLEAPFTMLMAVGVFGEHLAWRAAAAAGAIVVGGVALGWRVGEVTGQGLGAIAIAGACLSWAVDNNLTQRLSLRDPIAVVRLKALGAGMANLVLALGLGMRFPPRELVLAAVGVGAMSYGLSIVLDTYALRLVGAAREAAYFATAPFFGAAVAALVFGEGFGVVEGCAAAAMLVGVALLLRERHGHVHDHDALVHDHLHAHDEHHQHEHQDGSTMIEPHAHVHTHARLRHTHPHVSDAHHRHRHR